MLKITKNEAFMLREKGYGDFVKKSANKRHPTYFCVEERDNIYKYERGTRKRKLVRLSALNALKEYREKSTISSHE